MRRRPKPAISSEFPFCLCKDLKAPIVHAVTRFLAGFLVFNFFLTGSSQNSAPFGSSPPKGKHVYSENCVFLYFHGYLFPKLILPSVPRVLLFLAYQMSNYAKNRPSSVKNNNNKLLSLSPAVL